MNFSSAGNMWVCVGVGGGPNQKNQFIRGLRKFIRSRTTEQRTSMMFKHKHEAFRFSDQFLDFQNQLSSSVINNLLNQKIKCATIQHQ